MHSKLEEGYTYIKSIFNSMFFSFKVSWKASRLITAVRISITAVESILPLLNIWIAKLIIDVITQSLKSNEAKNGIKKFLIYCGILLSIQIISRFLIKIREIIESIHIDIINKNINCELMEKVSKLDISYFDSPKFYNELTIVRKDASSLPNLIWSTTTVIKSLINVVASLSMLVMLHWSFPIIILLVCIPNFITNKNFVLYCYRYSQTRSNDENKYRHIFRMFTDKSYAKDIKLYELKEYLIHKYNEIWSVGHKGRRKIVERNAFFAAITSIFPQICMLSVQLFAAAKVLRGMSSIGDYTFYSGMISNGISNTSTFMNAILEVYECNIKIMNYRNFLKWESRLQSCGDKKIEGIPLIEFKNVSFKYPETNRYVFRNISFKINPCEKIAFVGLNGAGKTTVTKLMMRFYEPTEGQILINGADIHEYDESEISKLFSCVFQDFARYAFSVRESIGVTNVKNMRDDQKMEDACLKSDAHKFINTWLKGYDTYLTKTFDEEGEELSGGQWQKIALSSAFFRDAGILILDEPTASLDPEAEYEIFNKLTSLSKNKSAVLISHRLSSVTMVDKIYVLENGTIIESGSHRELFDKDGRYAELFRMQAEKYFMSA